MATVKTLAKPFVRLDEGSEQFAVEQLGQASQASTRVSKSLTIDTCDFRGQKPTNFDPVGREFESLRAHHISQTKSR